jgi:hypothetical protein
MGLVVGLYMLGVVAPTLLGDVRSESGSELWFVPLFIGLAVLPYLILAAAARIVRYARVVLVAASLLFILDVSARTSVIFFAHSSTDSIALIFLPFVFVGFAALVWIVVMLLNAYRSAQATERVAGS